MNSQEILMERKMTYAQLVEYLQNKYGTAQFSYYCTPTCKSKNRKVSRTSEGLLCHHIDEDKAILLSNSEYAIQNPFDYQLPDRLVYCNYLEHLLLHVAIMREPRHPKANEDEVPGIGGALKFICPEINDYFNGYEYKEPWRITALGLIEDNFEDYLDILDELFNLLERDPRYKDLTTPLRLFCGFEGKVLPSIMESFFEKH